MRKPILQVRDLHIHYATSKGDVIAVGGIDFDLYEGETLGLVGESGSGKSTAAYGILRLLQPPGRTVGGQVILEDQDILRLSEGEFRQYRWKKLSLIPQGAMNSLNPTMRVHAQIADVIETHEGKQPAQQLKARILELQKKVGLPERVYNMYPHELSGGMKQRVCIAMAMALNPTVVISDEATSALDVVVQRVVIQTMLKMKEAMGVSMIMIGHDIALMAKTADRIAVMYAGHLVEVAPVHRLFNAAMHPYSQMLIESIPSLRSRQLPKAQTGITHDPRNPPPGCIFHLRCPFVMDICRRVKPPLREVEPEHQVACHLYEQSENGGIAHVAELAATAGNS